MSLDQNKALLLRYIEAVWHEKNPAAADNFLSPDFKRHRSPLKSPLTREQQKELAGSFQAAFPDVVIDVADMVAEGDKIAFRATLRGTHQGEFLGIAPTGRQVIINFLDIVRVEEDKFVEQWGGADTYDLLQQLRGG